MEDAHSAMSLSGTDGKEFGVFAVFDGHGGWQVSAAAQELLRRLLGARLRAPAAAEAPSTAPGAGAGGGGAGAESRVGDNGRSLGRLLREVVVDLDDVLLGGPLGIGQLLPKAWGHPFSRVGSTACIAVLDPASAKIVVANSGDSRAILCRGGFAVALSDDHKPENPGELKRILAAGGRVMRYGPCFRIDGGLNLSRALGDFVYKAHPALSAEAQRVIAKPDITVNDWELRSRTPADEFLVVACDGIFERMSRQDVIGFVRSGLLAGRSPEDVLRGLLDAACASNSAEPGQDNETAILVQWSLIK